MFTHVLCHSIKSFLFIIFKQILLFFTANFYMIKVVGCIHTSHPESSAVIITNNSLSQQNLQQEMCSRGGDKEQGEPNDTDNTVSFFLILKYSTFHCPTPVHIRHFSLLSLTTYQPSERSSHSSSRFLSLPLTPHFFP